MAAPPVGQQQPAAPVEESRLLSDEQVMQAIATFQVGDHVIAIGVQWVNGYLAAVENSPDFMIGDVRIDVPFVAQCRGVTIKRHGTPDVVLKAELKRHAPVTLAALHGCVSFFPYHFPSFELPHQSDLAQLDFGVDASFWSFV